MKILTRLLFITRGVRYALDGVIFARKSYSSDMEELKNKYLNSPMLIVGNGPSLNITPLDDFIGIRSIGMNKIDLLFDKVRWRPDLIVCTNNLVVQQHHEEMVKHGIPCLLSWKSRWFMPRWRRKEFTFFLNKNENKFSMEPNKGVGVSGTVTYTALQFAHYMGANPVILFGVDHSFQYEGAPNDIQKRTGSDSNHFDPNYFASGQYWGVPNLALSEYGYQQAKEAFEQGGRKVYDATVGGKLDIFEKISVEQALKLCDLGD
tara:strand:- start:6094 stop:6879 length:786 start_codon:yes stop_codon:yes gene_type:complete